MATFNAYDYARKYGIGKCKVKSEHGTTTVPGLPTAITEKGIADQAEKAVKEGKVVSHKFPAEVVASSEVNASVQFQNAKKAREFIEGILTTETASVKVA